VNDDCASHVTRHWRRWPDHQRAAVKALIVANEFLEAELESSVSAGYVRGYKHGRFKTYTG
jgi:hypothetical protein